MKNIIVSIIAMSLFIAPSTNYAKSKDMDAAKFIDELVKKVEPVATDDAKAYWKATTTGKKEWYKKYEAKEIELNEIYSDKDAFKRVKALKKADIKDPILKRQIDLMYLDYLENQIDPKLNEELVKKAAQLEEKFNVFRAKVGGVLVPDNKIRDVLGGSKNLAERKKYWEASKQIGALVSNDLLDLVRVRNKAARELGFKDYYEMMLVLQEQTVREVFGVLNQLAKMTDKPFKNLKKEIDTAIAKKLKIRPEELRPWHYEDPFFQEVPQIYSVALDKYFKKVDIIKLAQRYYDSMGMNVDDILKRSDLYERKGKYQHAYCMDIDRKGDVRILENVKNNEQWMMTTLHELGHGIYSKSHDAADLPYYLKDSAHTFTTEGVAEMFGGLVNNPAWLENFAFPSKKKEIAGFASDINKMKKADLLIFARWVLVMANFERAMYSDPDQDLNTLWWNLVERYQMVKRPDGRNAPDWAAKIHLTSAPVYYHNYQLGRLFTAQMENYIDKNIAPIDKAFINNKKTGDYLIKKVFSPGMRWKWDRYVKEATGEKLTAKYFAKKISE